MVSFNSIMIGTKQFETLTAFYEKLFEKAPEMVELESGFAGWAVGSTFLGVLRHSEMGGNTKDPGRIMLNFAVSDVQAEFERVQQIGASVVQAPYLMGETWIATLADPDGNYFQLMPPLG